MAQLSTGSAEDPDFCVTAHSRKAESVLKFMFHDIKSERQFLLASLLAPIYIFQLIFLTRLLHTIRNRLNNVMERLFGEVKRRSHKMAAAFRNEGSCLLLFYAVIRSLKFNKLTMSSTSNAEGRQEV